MERIMNMFKKMAANPKTPAILQTITTVLYGLLAAGHFREGQRRLACIFLACCAVSAMNAALHFSRLKNNDGGEGE